ncbi:MAG: type III-B CRISPR-associated protein Cas10/Cmr2 [Armatimonadota bacterium]|nr:type III-B CRISPR-associated protein Cas10/Cmr2 [Armatimonadota bacterium]MDR7528729.1 type III-B CRISPR-associated protein Cas10/Cmr2 [Armatimonadota bacterium]
MTDWRLKIFAYLHDPPDKPLALGRQGGHADWGQKLAARLGGEPAGERDRWEGLVRRADRLAAGADRSALLPLQQVVIDELRHPLSGRPIELDEARLDLRREEVREAASRALDEEVSELARHTAGDPQAAFLALWGLLPVRLRARRGRAELRGAWDLLPAETRMPNHPVVAHEALVSALTTVLASEDTAALLSFSVGPVQRFIAQARRASDLWAGSVLLAQAVLAAVEPIVRELGPDHVLFPALRNSRAFLAWLTEHSPWAARLRDVWPGPRPGPARTLGSLPNRFLALVPAGRTGELASRCEEAVQRWWLGVVGDAASWLEGRARGLAGYGVLAREQAEGQLRVVWAASPWPLVDAVRDPSDRGSQLAAWGRGGQPPGPVASYLEIIKTARDRPGGGPRPFDPNGGILYAACYESVERLVAAAKLTPRRVPRAEGGLKCSLCGERAVVRAPGRFEEQRELWRRVRESCEHSENTRGLLRRGEALCGVCWAKRRFGFEERAQGVPSTSEIAAAPFKAALLEKLGADEPPAKLREAAEVLVREVEREGRWSEAFVVPRLRRWKDVPGLPGRLVRIPGEVLLAYPREDREPDAEPVSREVVHAAAALRAEAERVKIPRPRPYLAVLVLDGDEMGKWLSGAKALPLRCYLSTRAREELESQFREWSLDALLERPWPMTPALHAAFSEACGVFSQRTARRTVEEEALGVLVYAGGDDVLALVPVGPVAGQGGEQATEIARRLRFRFSGHVSRAKDDGHDVVSPGGGEAGFVLDGEGLGLAFGGRATASAGIAVFHHRWPLGRALEAARAAEKYAKEGLGRDALGLTVLRRSGQMTVTGLGFRRRRGPLPDLVELALPIVRGAMERHAEGTDEDTRRELWTVVEELAHSARKPVEDAAGEPRGCGVAALAEVGGDGAGVPDPAWAFQRLCEAFSDAGPLSPRLVSEVEQRLGRLTREGVRAAGGAGPEPCRAAQSEKGAEQLERWLGLIEAAAFLGRGGVE